MAKMHLWVATIAFYKAPSIYLGHAFAFILLLGLFVSACSESSDNPLETKNSQKSPKLPLAQLPKYQVVPNIQIIRYHAFPKTKSQIQKEKIGQELKQELSFLMRLVVQKDLSPLEQKVNPKDGLWVDLKAHRSYQKIRKEIKEPESYLNVFYLNTTALREKTGDPEKLSVRDVLLVTRRMDVEVFYEGQDEYELRLHLADAPAYSFYLNNPVFRKKGGRWYVYRMF